MCEEKRKLKIPPWQLPYLEKHRIYELFHELARELVIQQPQDHIIFLKQILENAAKSRDSARVVLLGSPKVNVVEVANNISRYTGQAVFTKNSIMTCFDTNRLSRTDLTPQQVEKCLAYLVRTGNAYQSGWIMADIFENVEEAKQLVVCGILPTHVIHLIPPYDPPLDELLYCHVSEDWPRQRRKLVGLRDAFKATLIEVFLGKRKLREVVEEVMSLIKIRKGIAPIKPRVLIIGPRGSGRRSQALMLQDHLNIVHVDFEYLLCQTWISQTPLGEKFRSYEDEACFRSNLLAEILNQRILQNDCLENGYVLTGFPFTVMDFKYLDTLDTPPNRVIFLECDLNLCKEHLMQRRRNVDTGSITNLLQIEEDLTKKRLALHPLDKSDVIEAEHAYFCRNYGAMRSYCGQTATVINADQPQRWVFEGILATVARTAPACPPRNPYSEDKSDVSSSLDSPGSSYGQPMGSFVTKV